MITVSIARRYARALLDLGIAQHNLEELGQALDGFAAELQGSADLRAVMENPAFSREARQVVLAKLLATRPVPVSAAHLFQLLIDRNRITYLGAIAHAFRELVDARMGRVRAKVTSAIPLDAAALEKIRAELATLTQKQVTVEKAVDPSILGGVVAQVGSLTFDGSLANQLEVLRRQLRS